MSEPSTIRVAASVAEALRRSCHLHGARPLLPVHWATGCCDSAAAFLCVWPRSYHHAFFYSQYGVVGLMDAVMKTTDGSDFRGWKSAIVQRVVSGVTGGRLKKA